MSLRCLAGWIFLVSGLTAAQGQINQGLIAETTAQRHGLTKAWWGQVQLDRSVARLRDVSFQYGTVLAVTDRATVQAFDAETGKVLWTNSVGNRNFPTYAAGANAAICAVVNGSKLYLYELATGKLFDQRDLINVPSGPPAVSRDTVFIPTHRQLVEAHKLIETDRPARTYASTGNPIFAPFVAKESVIIPTERGGIHTLSVDGGSREKVTSTYGGLGAGVTYAPPYFYCASVGGYVYCVHETNGVVLWKRSVGDAVRDLPVVVNDAVYVTLQSGGMFRLKTTLGEEIWFTPHIKRFLAASPKRIYALDQTDRLVVLDAATGGRLDTLPFYGNKLAMTNWQNDRLYLATDTGLIQCLHEAGLKEPVNHLWEERIRVELPDGRLENFVKATPKDAKAGKAGAEKGPEKGPAKPSEPVINDPFGGGAAMPGPAKGPAMPAIDDPFK